jgi:hypothetical protein
MSGIVPKTWDHADRHGFAGGFDARIITRKDEAAALLGVWRPKRGEDEPEALSCNPRPTQHPSANLVDAAHAEFLAALAGYPPRSIPINADAIDLEDRADHLDKLFGALSVYVTAILDDTAQNVPGRLDLRDAEGVLADLASDVTGAIQHAADDMAGRPA